MMKEETTQTNAAAVAAQETRSDCCNCKGFFKFPLGWNAGACVLLALFALVLSLAGMGSCNFVSINENGFGLLWREETPSEAAVNTREVHCITFSPDQKDMFDGPWKAGAAFAYLSIIIVVLTAAVTFSLACATINKTSMSLLGAAFLATSITQALAFLIFGSQLCDGNDSKCHLSFGSGIAVGGIVLTCLSALSLFFMRSQLPEKAKAAQPVAEEGSAGETDVDRHEHEEEAVLPIEEHHEEELHEHPPDELDEPKEIDSEAGVMDEVSLDEEQEVDSGKKVPDDLAKEKEEV
jgi:hypothetical protein